MLDNNKDLKMFHIFIDFMCFHIENKFSVQSIKKPDTSYQVLVVVARPRFIESSQLELYNS